MDTRFYQCNRGIVINLEHAFDLNIGYANRSVYLLWSQIWAVFLFGEHLTMRNVLGIAIVLTGVVIVSLSAEQKEKGE